MRRVAILRPGAHPDAHRPQAQLTGGAPSGSRVAAAASERSERTLDALGGSPVPSGRRWAITLRFLRNTTPTAVIFTLNQDR
jgi:hypothetical protein